jgi:catechol-2,3-dioxygenase
MVPCPHIGRISDWYLVRSGDLDERNEPIMQVTFHQFGIVVPNLEKASQFYQQALGFEEQ